MGLVVRLIYLRNKKGLRHLINGLLLFVFHVAFPRSVVIGKNLKLQHGGTGTIINPYTRIGNNVTIYHGVTIGNATPWDDTLMRNSAKTGPEGRKYSIDIKDNVCLCAGCVILCKDFLSIGKGTVIGANSVLTKSTGENEIWGGYLLN